MQHSALLSYLFVIHVRWIEPACKPTKLEINNGSMIPERLETSSSIILFLGLFFFEESSELIILL